MEAEVRISVHSAAMSGASEFSPNKRAKKNNTLMLGFSLHPRGPPAFSPRDCERLPDDSDDEAGDGLKTGLVRSQRVDMLRNRIGRTDDTTLRGDTHFGEHKALMEKTPELEAAIMKGVRESRFFQIALSDAELQSIVDVMEHYEFNPGSVVVREGDQGQYFFFLHEGKLTVTQNEKVIDTCKAGECYGGISLMYDCPRSATVVVAPGETASIWAAHAPVLRSLLKDHAKNITQRNRQFIDKIVLFNGMTPMERDRLSELDFATTKFDVNVRVVAEDEPCVAIYFVKEGQLACKAQTAENVSKFPKDGLLKEGDCFGWRSLIYQERQPYSAITTEPSTLICLKLPELQKVFGENVTSELERIFVFQYLRNMPVFALLSRSLLSRISAAFEPRHYVAGERVPEDTRIVIVIDGEVGCEGKPAERGRRGTWCHDEGMGSLLCAEGKFHFANRNLRQSDKMHLGHLLKDVSPEALKPGERRCRLATLSKKALVEAILPDRSKGVPDEDVIFLRKLLLSMAVPIFRHLSDKQLENLADSFVLQEFEAGFKVFSLGEVGRAFYMVESGFVEVLEDDGSLLKLLGPNSSFGERALVLSERRSKPVRIGKEPAKLWVCPCEIFDTVVTDAMRESLGLTIQLQNRVSLKLLKHARMIGKGAFGTVRLVEHKRLGTRYALKRINKKADGLGMPDDVKQEVELLRMVDHPFVLRLFEVFETTKSFYLLLELITGGQLYEHVMENLGVLGRKSAQFYVGSLALILEALHDKMIAYRDLKPENVMLDYQGYVKLVDFGLAKRLGDSHGQGSARTFTLVGTLYYMAPEVIRGSGYGTECDVWSLGVLMYEMVCGILPFGNSEDTGDEMDNSIIFDRILTKQLEFPAKYTDSAGKRLITGLLEKDSDRRLGVRGVGGWTDIKDNKYFKAGVTGDLFQQIAGRAIVPPVIPEAEMYADTRKNNLDGDQSDADELGKDDPLDVGCRVMNAFNKFDLNGDGKIDKTEMFKVLNGLDPEAFTEDVVDQLMTVADSNGDGVIRYDEFVEWIFSDTDVATSRVQKQDKNIKATLRDAFDLDAR